MESDTPIGFLQGAGGVSTQIAGLMELAGPMPGSVVLFGDDPTQLVTDITKALDHELSKYKDLYT
jgi:hypothetical protein